MGDPAPQVAHEMGSYGARIEAQRVIDSDIA